MLAEDKELRPIEEILGYDPFEDEVLPDEGTWYGDYNKEP